jgi:hypothetical protein
MGKMATQLQLLLLQLQDTFGTAETDLTGADLIEVMGPPEFVWDPDITEIDLVAGAFDQDAAVPGASSYELTGKAYMRTGNASGDYAQIDTLLQASCMVGVTSAGPIKTYSFTSTRTSYKDATAWGYSGDLSTSSSLLRKMSNIILRPKWTLEAGKPSIMEFVGTGVYGGAAANATQPAITKERVSPPALLGATVTINGDADYQLIKAEIDATQAVDLTVDAAATYGRGNSAITNRKIKWTATVYMDVTGTVDPEAALLGQTEGALSIAYGTAPNKVTFAMTNSQITATPMGDENGVQVWNLEGQANQNNFTVALDTTP